MFEMKEKGHIYSRISNPTVAVFEERMAALEGGKAAVAARLVFFLGLRTELRVIKFIRIADVLLLNSSGQAAQFMAIAAIAGVGDNIVTTSYLYGPFPCYFLVLDP